MTHEEHHKTHRSGWLRASVMGANDGLISTSSLIIGVAASNSDHYTILMSSVAALVAGAMSMAAGEYVSVSSQADIEAADIALEKAALADDYEGERRELIHIYMDRGLDEKLAEQVAQKLMAYDALATHMRDEIGISEELKAQPVLAAVSSATWFALGAALPILCVWLSSFHWVIPVTVVVTLVFLVLLGAAAAHVGGASRKTGAIRVLFWGAAAMSFTGLTGYCFSLL